MSIEQQLEQAIRERDEARATKAILPIHGCLTGDCPHDNANQCVEALKEYVVQMEQAELELQAELTQLRKDNETLRNAQKSCVDCDAPTLEEVKQLRKVCDELYWLSQYSDRQCSRKDKVIANYSTLPHVIKAKGK